MTSELDGDLQALADLIELPPDGVPIYGIVAVVYLGEDGGFRYGFGTRADHATAGGNFLGLLATVYQDIGRMIEEGR